MLDIRWSTAEPPAAAGQLLVVPLAEGFDDATVAARFVSAVLEAAKAARLLGKPGDAFAFTREHGDALTRVVLVGIGKSGLDAAAMRTLAHDAVRQAQA